MTEVLSAPVGLGRSPAKPIWMNLVWACLFSPMFLVKVMSLWWLVIVGAAIAASAWSEVKRDAAIAVGVARR